MNLRLLLHALVAGLLLGTLRAPTGLDLTQMTAVEGSTAALFRAGALGVVALFLDPRRPAFRGRFRPGLYLFVLALAFAFQGLFLGTLLQPSRGLTFGLTLAFGAGLLRWISGRRGAVPKGEAPPLRVDLEPVERATLVVLGLALALGLESLAHETRLYTLGLPEEESVIGATIFLLTAFGAAAFGPLVSRRGFERTFLAGGLLLALAAAVFGLGFLGGLDREGLFGYLTRMDTLVIERVRSLDLALGDRLGLAGLPRLDPTAIGTWWATALITATTWVAPAFLLGAAFACARHPGRLGHALLGVALGTLLRPWVLAAMAAPVHFPEQAGTPWAWNWIAGSVLLGTVAVAALALAEGPGRQRLAGVVLALFGLLLPFVPGRPKNWNASPWYASDIRPSLVVPTAAGHVAVEELQGSRVVTLDRRRITPRGDEEAADLERLRRSLDLIEATPRSRVLFVGQLTPARAWLFEGFELDRTAPWYRAFPAVDQELFGDEVPPGRVLSPGVARGRLQAGDYDLVIVAESHGPVLVPHGSSRTPWAPAPEPLLGHHRVPAGTLAVVWQRADAPVSRRAMPEHALLSLKRFENLTLGLILGELPSTRPAPEGLANTGDPLRRPSGFDLLSSFPRHRDFETTRRTAERLARAGLGSELEDLVAALQAFYALQTPSSPFETQAEQLELEEAVLADLARDLKGCDLLDDFRRGIWNDVAWLLTEKRLPHLSLAYLTGPAARFAPWPELEVALGTAHLELLEAETALDHFDRALEVRPHDVLLLSAAADAAHEAGLVKREIELLTRALAVQPGNELLEERLREAETAIGAPREASLPRD